jgi:hypothetical protein
MRIIKILGIQETKENSFAHLPKCYLSHIEVVSEFADLTVIGFLFIFRHRRATNRQRRVASVRRHAESIYDPRWFASACAIFSAPAARRVIRVPPPRESIGDPIHHPPRVVPS